MRATRGQLRCPSAPRVGSFAALARHEAPRPPSRVGLLRRPRPLTGGAPLADDVGGGRTAAPLDARSAGQRLDYANPDTASSRIVSITWLLGSADKTPTRTAERG